MKGNKPRISSDRYEELTALAAEVADLYCPSGTVDPEVVIKAKGLTLSYGDFADCFDGMLEFKAGRFHIYCNTARENIKGSARGRFTLAHELGHYFIDEHRNGLASGKIKPHPSFADKNVGDILVEREADLFASYLLLPPSRFQPLATKYKPGLGGVASIATLLNVSITCASVRYVTSGIAPCVIVKWSPDSFQWRWCSTEFWQAGFRWTIESMDAVLPDSATGQCFSAGSKPTGVLASTTVASKWFPTIPERGNQNIVLREEAMTLGRFGSVTSLTPIESMLPKNFWERARESYSGDF